MKSQRDRLGGMVAEIRMLDRAVAASAYRIGQIVSEIKEKGLWRPRYPSFKEMVRQEFPDHCDDYDSWLARLARIAQRFDENVVVAIGIAKSSLLLNASNRLSPEQLTRFVVHAETCSVRELRDSLSAAQPGQKVVQFRTSQRTLLERAIEMVLKLAPADQDALCRKVAEARRLRAKGEALQLTEGRRAS